MKATVFPECHTTNDVFSTQNKKCLEMICNDLLPDNSAGSCHLRGILHERRSFFFPKEDIFVALKID